MTDSYGFTLIELLVTVLIIGILAAIALPRYEIAVEKAAAAEALTVLRTTKDAMERYKLSFGSYPSSFDVLDVSIPSSKNWFYSIAGQYSIYAQRNKPSDHSYLIAYRFDGNYERIICRCDNNKDYGKKICMALGAVRTDGDPAEDWILSE